MLIFIISFVLGVSLFSLGYSFGIRQGRIKGMNEFISIIKVYDRELVDDIALMLHNVGGMSQQEKEEKFRKYIQQYMNTVE